MPVRIIEAADDGDSTELPQKIGRVRIIEAAPPPPKPASKVKDAGKGFGSGVLRSALSLADQALALTPAGAPMNALNLVTRQAPGTPNALSPTRLIAPTSTKLAGYQPETREGRYSQSVGEMLPNAFAPGGLVRRALNVVLPGVGSEGAREAVEAAGGNQLAQGVAKAVGGILGAGAASVRGMPTNPLARPQPAARIRNQDPAAMQARAAEIRANGAEPTLVDVVDDAGRGIVKAAANRNTPGRQVANDFARTRALNLPDRISQQARRTVSNDPRTPDQIRGEMGARRAENAQQAFGAVRGDLIDAPPEAMQAMQTPYGRQAVAEAARRERDPQTRQALTQLARGLDNPNGVQMSVGMADRISRVLLSRAQAAGRSGDNDLAATFTQLGNDVRNPARQASPGYGQALEGFAADSRLQDAAGVGEDFTRRNTDEFVQFAQGLSDEERQLALAAARRAVERGAGENIASAPGVARRLADAPEQQTRNAALMGPERAGQFQNAMRTEAQAVENAGAIAPSRGSPTYLNAADGQQAEGVARIGQQLLRRDVVGFLMDRWRARGMNDREAEALVRIATDPGRTDEAIQIIARRLGPEEAQQFLNWRNAAMVGALSAGASGAPAAAAAPPQR